MIPLEKSSSSEVKAKGPGDQLLSILNKKRIKTTGRTSIRSINSTNSCPPFTTSPPEPSFGLLDEGNSKAPVFMWRTEDDTIGDYASRLVPEDRKDDPNGTPGTYAIHAWHHSLPIHTSCEKGT